MKLKLKGRILVVCVGVRPCGIHILVDWQIGSSHIASMGCNGGLRKDWEVLNLGINVSTNAQIASRPKEGEQN